MFKKKIFVMLTENSAREIVTHNKPLFFHVSDSCEFRN